MRYFLEVSYNGTRYSGFQKQKNANSIQQEIESAVEVLHKEPVQLVCSSRTDAGVHAMQNYFHFDINKEIESEQIYNLNAILPDDIVIRKIIRVNDKAHCRFDAVSREYKYYIYNTKNPFISDRAYYYPYTLNLEKMEEAAEIIKEYTDFSSFSKKRTQVKNFNCSVTFSKWATEAECIVYHVIANRFLRGMVRGLTATMLMVGREKITISDFRKIIESGVQSSSNFAVPAHGLFLIRVAFPENYFD